MIMPEKKGQQLIEIAPDGPQGNKLRLGVTDIKQIDNLRQEVQTNGKGLNIQNIRQSASKLNIPVIDN